MASGDRGARPGPGKTNLGEGGGRSPPQVATEIGCSGEKIGQWEEVGSLAVRTTEGGKKVHLYILRVQCTTEGRRRRAVSGLHQAGARDGPREHLHNRQKGRGKGGERKRGSRGARGREAQAPPTRNRPTISFSYATLQPDGKCRAERRRRRSEF